MRTLARHRYLAHFRKNQTATADELARALNVTPANVRYHLAGLLADGLVQVVEIRHREKKGRPVKVYGLSTTAQGDNLNRLVDAILTDWLNLIAPGTVEEAMARIAQGMAEASLLNASGAIAQRLVKAIDHFNRMHYQARWEAHGAGPRIIFESCPYAGVIANHPELCQLDVQLLQKYLGGEIEQLAKREKGLKNFPVCIFTVA